MYLRMLHVPFWLWHSLILTLPLPIASNMEISVHCEEFSYFDFSGILLLLWPAYYSIWVSNDCQGLCICSFNPNTFYHSVGSCLLEVLDCGWPLCISVMFPVDLWDIQVLVSFMSASLPSGNSITFTLFAVIHRTEADWWSLHSWINVHISSLQ